MAYTEQTWADGSGGGTPLSAARLSHVEDGIEAAQVTADSKYLKPGGGIPKTDLDSSVQASLSAADAAAPNTATNVALANKQPIDSDLTTIAGLTPADNDLLQRKSGAWINRTPAQVKTDLALVKADVGLGNVDNTSDVNKPVSTAQQTALNGRQPLDADLTAISALTSATDTMPYYTGAGTAALATVTAFARTVLDDTSAAAMRTTLGATALSVNGSPVATYNYVPPTASDVGAYTTSQTDAAIVAGVLNPKVATIKDTGGSTSVAIAATASAVNYLTLTNSATNAGLVQLGATGTDTNLALMLVPKGTGGVQIYAATGVTPRLVANGVDTNVNLNLQGKGTGIIQANGVEVVTLTGVQTLVSKTLTAPKIVSIADVNGNTVAGFPSVASAVNYLSLANSVTGTSPSLTASGTDASVQVVLTPKGPAPTVTVWANSAATGVVKASGSNTDVHLNLVSQGAGKVQANGAEVVRRTVQTITTAVTLGANGDYVVLVGSGGSPTLPTAVGNTGRYSFKNVNTADQLILTTGGQTIEGQTSWSLVPQDAIEVISDGSNWKRIASNDASAVGGDSIDGGTPASTSSGVIDGGSSSSGSGAASEIDGGTP